MNERIRELAMKCAEALVEYHEAQNSTVCDKDRWVREARDAMHDAQNALNEACERQAGLNA